MIEQPSHANRIGGKARFAQFFAWLFAVLALVFVAAGVVASVSTGEMLPLHMLFAPVATFAYAFVGILVAAYQPRNPIGWLFSAVAICAGTISLIANGMNVCLWTGAGLPCHALVRWLDLWLWMPVTILPLTFVLLLFPNGSLPSQRWRPVAWATGIGLALFVLSTALHPRPPIEPIPPVNPFGVSGLEGLLEALSLVAGMLLAVGCVGSLVALVVRFRRARGAERKQLQWLTYGGMVAIGSVAAISAWAATRPSDQTAYELNIGSIWLALSIIVLAAGTAILHNRLYNIDLIINRTLVFGALSAGVVGLYVVLVGMLGSLFQSSGDPLLALLATGLAAFLIQPLRAWLQRGVNRLMYGKRDDPYAVLSGLSQQIKTTLAPAAVLPSIAEAIGQTLKLPYVALALSHSNRFEIAAAYGMPVAQPLRLPLVYQAETVGELLIAPRTPGEAFTPKERRLLEDIALQAGVAVHAVRLTADLQQSRERLVATREEERRRLRRNLHDGLGPQLASLSLTVAAARELIHHDPHTADALLQQLAHHTQTAIADIRRLVYDLRPPALDDLGLLLALREHAASYSHANLQILIEAPAELPPLPAAVEVAAYRIVQEALTNVIRHAQARTCVVRLRLHNGLELEICDDGIGLPRDLRAGVGLTSIRERTAELGGTCQIEPAPGGGTCVRAQLPL